ncbi:MAG: LysM peptidoglycan-binding domain-containing protein, partial [Anaerolineaceae bacterium]|nr:LysM peptidoglycan-binding domain-containing protein [Anaerolineaceae bacterium]
MEENSLPPQTSLDNLPDDFPGESGQASKGLDWNKAWEFIVRLGLGEISLRVGAALLSIAFVLLVLWVMGNFYLVGQASPLEAEPDLAQAATLPTPTPQFVLPPFSIPDTGTYLVGVRRLAQLHTILPAKPRLDVITYEVQQGDTLFGIGEKFNLSPETILWGNYETLYDDPHSLSPGQILYILPVDGVYYQWHAGDGLNGVSKFYGVTPETIIEWDGNNLSFETIGDYAAPNIDPDTWLVIPGGRREFVTWSAPRITRDDPAVAKVYGPGYCGEVMDGPIGNGTFVWPTVDRFLSGYDYSPETNHRGIDIGGVLGNAIFAVDSGVVVYAGWNDW